MQMGGGFPWLGTVFGHHLKRERETINKGIIIKGNTEICLSCNE